MILSFELTRLGSRPKGCLTAEKLTQLYSYRRLICISFRGRFKNILNDYYSETTSFFLWEKTLIYCRWEQYKVYCHQSQLISVRHWNRHFLRSRLQTCTCIDCENRGTVSKCWSILNELHHNTSKQGLKYSLVLLNIVLFGIWVRINNLRINFLEIVRSGWTHPMNNLSTIFEIRTGLLSTPAVLLNKIFYYFWSKLMLVV